MYHLKVIREGKMIVIQIGCVEHMRELTMGLIEYAMDRDEFHSFEKSQYAIHRDKEGDKLAQEYVDECAEVLYNRKRWKGFGK